MSSYHSSNEKSVEQLNPELITKAIETVKIALPLFVAEAPIFKKGIKGEFHIDIPIMYMNFGVDRVHYDPYSKMPSPKGRPIAVHDIDVDHAEIHNIIERVLKESYVIEAVEFREHEKAWVVPIAWNKMIIMHVKVSYKGRDIIPDYKLTEEVRRHVP